MAGTIDQLVTDVPSGLSLTPPQEKKKEIHIYLPVYVPVMEFKQGAGIAQSI
jgi:hypothetical protein